MAAIKSETIGGFAVANTKGYVIRAPGVGTTPGHVYSADRKPPRTHEVEIVPVLYLLGEPGLHSDTDDQRIRSVLRYRDNSNHGPLRYRWITTPVAVVVDGEINCVGHGKGTGDQTNR